MTASVHLSAADTGFDDEADFDAWVDYVSEHIDDACGFRVEVTAAAFTGRNATFEDEITAADDGQVEAIREALRDLWDRGCAESFGADTVGEVQS